MSKQPARSEKKQRTRESILRSAEKLVRTRGIAGASVAEVMGGAQLTVGGFYAHFGSKDALVEHTLRRALGQMREKLVEGMPAKGSAPRLLHAAERYLSTLHRDHPALGCPLPSTVGELAGESLALRRAVGEELDAHAAALVGPEDRDMALGVLALMVGGLSLSRAFKGTPLSEDVLRGALLMAHAALDTRPRSAPKRIRSRAKSRKGETP